MRHLHRHLPPSALPFRLGQRQSRCPGLLRHSIVPVHQRCDLSGTSAIEPQRLRTVVPGHIHSLHHHAKALQRPSDALCQEEGQAHRHQKHQAKHPREAPEEFLLAVALQASRLIPKRHQRHRPFRRIHLVPIRDIVPISQGHFQTLCALRQSDQHIGIDLRREPLGIG